jgi:hypothetical protein
MMRSLVARILTPRSLRGAVLLIGFAWSATLYALAPTDVFYTGDAGLKSLLIDQLARGDLKPQLALPAQPWLRGLWSDGFYPFGPPFVYDAPAAHTVSFPIYFSLLCAPFYALAGLRGAMLVPLIALWGVWLQVYRLCRIRALSEWQTTGALATVVIASPLTLYGALLWEHTVGVLLFTFGLEAWCLQDHQLSARRRALLGLLAGGAAAMRPEAYVPLALLALMLLRQRAFLLGLALSVLAIWSANLALYGKPLGLHGTQVLEQSSFLAQLWARASSMDRKLVFTTPAIVLALYAGIRALLERRRFAAQGFVVLLLSLLAVPLIVPNDGIRQIGPRYFLLLIPLIALLAAELRGRWVPVAFGATLLLGLRFDVARASRELLREYRKGRTPAVAWMQNAPEQVLVVERQETAHELASLFPSKDILRADDDAQLARLSDALHARGHATFMLVRFARDPSKIADALVTPDGRRLALVSAHEIGAFAVREMRVR